MLQIFYETLRTGIWLLVLMCACGTGSATKPSKGNQSGSSLNGANAPLVYVALGDSTGVGVGARNGGYVERLMKRILELRPGSNSVNLCAAGATTAEVLNQQVNRSPTGQTTFITLGVGINDLVQGVSEQEFAQNYEQIVAQLDKAGAAVLLMNLPDLTAFPAMAGLRRDDIEQLVERFNQRIAEIAGRYKLPLFDLHHFSRDMIRTHPEFISEDGFHPSDAGYEFWTVAMWPQVEQTIKAAHRD